MKKMILFLGIVVMLLACLTPQATAADMDVGYAFVLPADNNAVVSTACQAASNSPRYVISVELRDHGDRCIELSAQSTGLRAENSYNIFSPPPSGYLYGIPATFQLQTCTRLKDSFNRRNPYIAVVSTSNGGAGY